MHRLTLKLLAVVSSLATILKRKLVLVDRYILLLYMRNVCGYNSTKNLETLFNIPNKLPPYQMQFKSQLRRGIYTPSVLT